MFVGADKSDPLRARPILWVAFIVLAVGVGVGCSGSGSSTGTASYPDTSLAPLAGGSAQPLSAFRGTPLIVNLWAPWCTPCVREMPEFEKVHLRLGDQVKIVGVTDAMDTAGSKRLAKSTGVTYPLLVDEDGTLQTDLRVINLPTTVFFDADGKILKRHAGALTASGLSSLIETLYDID